MSATQLHVAEHLRRPTREVARQQVMAQGREWNSVHQGVELSHGMSHRRGGAVSVQEAKGLIARQAPPFAVRRREKRRRRE